MFQLLLEIISYGSLLVLLVPQKKLGAYVVASLFMLGTGLIVYKGKHSVSSKVKRYGLIPAVVIILAYLGVVFFNRWLHFRKLRSVATFLHMSVETMLFVGSVVLTISAFYFSYLVLIRIVNVLDDALEINSYSGSILFGLLAAVITVVLAQVMIEVKIFSMGIVNFMYGVLIVWAVILFLFCITGKIRPSTPAL